MSKKNKIVLLSISLVVLAGAVYFTINGFSAKNWVAAFSRRRNITILSDFGGVGGSSFKSRLTKQERTKLIDILEKADMKKHNNHLKSDPRYWFIAGKFKIGYSYEVEMIVCASDESIEYYLSEDADKELFALCESIALRCYNKQ